MRELLGRRLASGLALAGLCTASLGFALMTGGAQYTQAHLHGDLGKAWSARYDLLVRPSSSVGPAERKVNLIPQNFSTGSAGGITYAQLAAIRALPDVQVAAPLVVVGSVNWDLGSFTVPLTRPGSALTAFHVAYSERVDSGMVSYDMDNHIALVASEGTITFPPRSRTPTLTTGGKTMDCAYPVFCWAPRLCDQGECGPYPDPPSDGIEIWQPIPIAGVDPAAEAQLIGLDQCLKSGRYLAAGDTPQPNADPPGTNIPVLVSTRSFVDTQFVASVSSWGVQAVPAPSTGSDPPDAKQLQPFVASANDLYQAHLASIGNDIDFWPVWRTGQTSYRTTGDGRLAPIGVTADLSVYEHPNFNLQGGSPDELRIPPESRAGWFRPVTSSYYKRDDGDRRWDVVGTYDPACLPGFDALSRAGMETYAAPQVMLDDGRTVGPDRSVGGYVASPPLILTNIAGANWLMDDKRFTGQNSAAPISSVRIRVRSLATNFEQAQARLEQVAVAIRDRTGLNVDLVRGSSPQTVPLELELGDSLYPATEVWTKKGVVIAFDRALTLQTLALLVQAASLGAMLTMQTGFTAVRRRRRELGMLRALGWSAFDSFRLVLYELVILGGLAALASLVALLIARRFGLQAPNYVLAGPAVGLVAALAGGLAPAAVAARTRPAAAIAHVQWSGRSRRHSGSRLLLGALEMWRAFRVEAASSAILVGAGALTVAAVAAAANAFLKHLDSSWLGFYLGGQVRPFHVILAVTAAVIAALAATQLTMLAYLERRQTLAALRATGWSRFDVLVFIVGGGLLISLPGVLLAAAGIALVGFVTGMSASALALPLEVATGTGLACGLLAIVGPAALALRSAPAALLRGE